VSKRHDDRIPITTRALYQRIARVLRERGQILRSSGRNAQAQKQLGAHYLIDTITSTIVRKHVDLPSLADELAVLRPYERVTD
jgi:hypothetical protein